MSRRQKSRRRNVKRPAPGSDTARGAGRQVELDRLRGQTQADHRLLAVLLGPGAASPEAEALIGQARERYEQNLLRTCAVLEELLGRAEANIAELRQQNRSLRQANESLKYKADKLALELRRALGVKAGTGEREDGPEPAGDADTSAENKPEPSSRGKRGAPKGHRGRNRGVPDRIDREQLIGPADSCTCGCFEIDPLLDFDLRYVEDIPAVSKEITRQIYLHGRCRNCGKVVRHPEAIGKPLVVTGPNLAAHLTIMHQMGVTFRKLSHFSTNTLGIELSPSGALGIVERVGRSLWPPYGEILRSLPDQDWLNGDETGWKVMGRNGYIWCFCNREIAFFHHDYRRSAKVIEQILGDRFGGIVICDFYAAYNCLDNTQRCLVHLLRDIKTEREVLRGSKLLERFEKAVSKFIEKGLQVQAMPDGAEKDRELEKLEKRLDRLTRMKVTKGKATTLVKRIEKYRDDLIRFVTHPGVEFHNNRAERALRPIVVNRKVSFGSNTERGARRYCIIHTIVETCKLQGIDPIEFIRRAYTSGGLDVPTLTGADPPAAAA
jgi:transposase